MLVQLIYISTIVGVTFDQMEGLRETARLRNIADGICGLLLITDNNYIHYIEGERSAVIAKYEEVSHYSLHKQCTLLRFIEIPKREFPDFVSTYVKLSDIAKEDLAKLDKIDPSTITSATALSYIRRMVAHHRADR